MESLLESAERLLRAGNAASAQYALDEITGEARSSERYWRLAAEVSVARGDAARAVFQLDQAAALGAGGPHFRAVRADALAAAGQYAEAQSDIRQAVAMLSSGVLADRVTYTYVLETARPLLPLAEVLPLAREATAKGHVLKDHLAAILVEAAEDVPTLRDGEDYVVATSAEVNIMHAMLSEARQLEPTDPAVNADLQRMNEVVARAVQRLGGNTAVAYAGPLGSGCGQKVLTMVGDDRLSRLFWAGSDAALEVLPRYGWSPAGPWAVHCLPTHEEINCRWSAPDGTPFLFRSGVQRGADLPSHFLEFRLETPDSGERVAAHRAAIEGVFDGSLHRVRGEGIGTVIESRGGIR